ncbi:hypothetical protein [Poriferisphaera sp. WC338]|uniref:hypothetical protein n=1 Tax=Poriferisphaera sp. WC338 TaxID=3425129 RepID=UPI003D81910D
MGEVNKDKEAWRIGEWGLTWLSVCWCATKMMMAGMMSVMVVCYVAMIRLSDRDDVIGELVGRDRWLLMMMLLPMIGGGVAVLWYHQMFTAKKLVKIRKDTHDALWWGIVIVWGIGAAETTYVIRNDGLARMDLIYVLFACIFCGVTMGVLILLLWLDFTRPREGFCSNCEFDLQGTIAAERNECPECGEAIGREDHPAASSID